MTAPRRRAGATLLLAIAACQSAPTEPAAPPPPSAASPQATSASPSKPGGDGAPARESKRDASLADFETAKVLSGKSIGHTSVVFKLSLAGGLTAAYKPASKRGPTRYKGEIAAYRFGLALGLPNVPPALPRSFGRAELLAALGGKDTTAGKLFDDEAITDDKGQVRGALIPWIPHLDFLPLEAEPRLSEWRRWLSGTSKIPPEDEPLAAQISQMIVFDYVTANWDRWSGGNVGWDEADQRVLFVDNDAAFFDKPPIGLLMAQYERLSRAMRFSRTEVERLRGLDEASLTAAMGKDGKEPLLPKSIVTGVLTRRDLALKAIDGKAERFNRQVVLGFE